MVANISKSPDFLHKPHQTQLWQRSRKPSQSPHPFQGESKQPDCRNQQSNGKCPAAQQLQHGPCLTGIFLIQLRSCLCRTQPICLSSPCINSFIEPNLVWHQSDIIQHTSNKKTTERPIFSTFFITAAALPQAKLRSRTHEWHSGNFSLLERDQMQAQYRSFPEQISV